MLIKKLIFKAMRLVQFDFNITHHWVSEHKMRVHSFQHKNYWWHGKNRERSEMLSIKKLLKNGDTVIEIGGHIGYISVYMSNLVGKNGSVHVFEPGGNNYRYIKNNTENLENITLEKMAVSDSVGVADFFVEDLSGQNNSLISDIKILEENQKNASISVNKSIEKVPVTTVDYYVNEKKIEPNFFKIDAEGAEFLILKGMIKTTDKFRPIVMIEFANSEPEMMNFFLDRQYTILDSNLHSATFENNDYLNVFCIPTEKLQQMKIE